MPPIFWVYIQQTVSVKLSWSHYHKWRKAPCGNKVWINKVDLCPDGCYIDSVPVGGALLRQSLRVGGLPFDVRMEQPNKETMAAMLEAERIARDPSVKRYTDVEEALRVLKE